ncbi:MAG: cation transporter [Clostridiales bacterium]|nr:cation transporter [Clostridiales bacterium]
MGKESKDNKDMAVLSANREKTIVRTSIIGIVTNVLLAAFKAAVGLISNSIAVTLDAVNNLSDALSSVITIIGAKLGAKKPDKKHPLGYGRIEYLSSMIVAAIVLYAGITSLVESVKKIIHPEAADYGTVSLIIIAVAIIVKLVLGRYVKKQGEKVNSGALVASGKDASFDAILSASVLASAIVFLIWGISLEAYVGVIISIVIIKAGIEMMIETLNDIIGQRGDAEMTRTIKKLLTEEPEIRGAYDLNLFNYGPDKYYGSVHMELPDTMTVDEVDVLTRKIQIKVYQETGVILTGIGVYSYNTSNDEAAEIRNTVQKTILSNEWALQMHGFYVDIINKAMRFDVVVSFDIDHKEAVAIMTKQVQELYPDYTVSIISDIDVTDI